MSTDYSYRNPGPWIHSGTESQLERLVDGGGSYCTHLFGVHVSIKVPGRQHQGESGNWGWESNVWNKQLLRLQLRKDDPEGKEERSKGTSMEG